MMGRFLLQPSVVYPPRVLQAWCRQERLLARRGRTSKYRSPERTFYKEFLYEIYPF